jgi:ribosome biogenesis protein UTP30
MVAVSKHASPMVDSDLLNKAIGALLKHHSNETSEKNSLLGNEESIQVQFTLNRVPEQTSARPIRIEIPHSFHKMKPNNDDNENTAATSDGAEEVEACLFVKDESKEWVKEMIDKFPSHLSCIQKVITLTSLRKKYAQYKDRRELLKKYNLFMADDRILPMLGKSLGKNFFQEKKQPIPVKLTRAEAFPFTIQKCLSSTFMHISAGTCISIKAGNTSMPLIQIVENAAAVVLGAVGHIPRKWANVSAIHIKTATSVALPVYNKTREELEEISRLAKKGELNNSTTNKDPSKKRVRDNSEDDAAMDEMQTQEKKKKKELANSPLAKALKKAKAESAVEKETKKEVEGTPVAKKKSKKSDETAKTHVSENVKSSKKTKASDAIVKEKTPVSDAKKAKSEEKGKDFIASKKFKGAKKGYVFRKGKNGLGYYIDIKPVVDKMALDALARINKGGGNVKRRHSTGGKSSKSRGRRSL